ncbi:MAG: tlde1 domain-containing protein [Rhizobium sp.]
MTTGTVLIGAGVVAFAWVVATAFTLQSVAGTYGPSASLRVASVPPIGHSSLRLAAVNPIESNALAFAKAKRSAVAAEMAALASSYSVLAKSGRVAMAEIADAGQSTSHALSKSARPLPQDVMAALKLALNVAPAGTTDAAAIRTASLDLNRAAVASERALAATTPASPTASHDDRLALADAGPATAINSAEVDATGKPPKDTAMRNVSATPGQSLPTGQANLAVTAANHPVQLAMLDPATATNSDTRAVPTAPLRSQAPAKPTHLPATVAHEIVPQPRAEDGNDGLPSSASAMVEPEDRRANVAVEQTFGLVMPTASGDAAGNASADDMLMSSIPLPTMRPAPLPDAVATPAAKLSRPSKALLAYARPDDAGEDNQPIFRAPSVLPNARTRVAIYDISAARVYLPNGEQLEAHSGMGGMIDNPRYVNQKNRGPTPPHTYDLTLRESLFHGVQALRLNPVNASAIYGRDGLLAHTYMLGRRGDSNGCVVFKDYNRFLAAFRRGDVNRLLVVPHLSVAPGRIASR